jgi:PAS domain S-box-containing protein
MNRKNPEKRMRHQKESGILPDEGGGMTYDITKHKQAEEELKASEELYKALVETTGTGYVIIDTEGRVLDANPEYVRLTGYRTVKEIIGKNVIEWTAAYEKEKNAEAVEKCAREGYIRNLEIDYMDLAGKITPVEINATVVQIQGTTKILTLCRDITRRKQEEMALHTSEEKFRQLFTRMPSAVAIYDAVDGGKDFIFKDFNAAAEKIEGIKKDDLIGKRVTQVFPGVKDFGIFGAFCRVWRTGQPEFFPSALYRDEHDHGTWRESWVYKLASGEVIAIYHDITGRKRTEDALQESESFNRGLVENLPDYIIVYGPDGKILYVNSATARVLGYDADTLAGTSVLSYVAEEQRDEVISRMRIRHEGREVPAYETIIVARDGSRRSVIAKGTPIQYHDSPAFLILLIDITERKRAEEALRESKALVDAVVENVPLMIFLKEATDLRFVIFNRAGEELLGYDRQALLGKNNLDLFPPEQAANFMTKDREVLDGDAGMLDIPEEPIMTAKKGLRLLHTRKVCIRGADGTTKFLLGISEDITERKQAEEKLKFSNVILSTEQDVSIDGILVVDESGKIISFNRRFIEIWGIPQDVVASRSDERALKSVIDKLSDPEEFLARVNYLYTKRDEKSREEIVLKDGRVLDRYSVPMSGSHGKYYGRVWNFRDITERKRGEEALRESKALIDAVVENVPLMIFLKEATDLRFVIFNRAGEELLGYDRQALLGKNNLDLFPPEQAANFMTKDREVLDGDAGMLDIPEEPITTAKKGLRLLHTRKVCIRGADGTTKFLLGISEDITERKQAEEKLKRFNEELEQQVKSRTAELNVSLEEKEGLLKEIHHRVRNNLQIVSSLISLQVKSIHDPASLKQIKEIRMRIGTLALVHEIAYLEKTPESINMKDFLPRCASRVIDEFGCEPGRINVTITAENVQLVLNQAVPCSLIINELLMNSIRHAFPGKRYGEIRIGFSIAKGNYVMEYSDDGVGFPEGMQTEGAQTGGLSLIQGLARQIRGTIESRTRPGTGYTLTFPAEVREGAKVWQK